MGDKLDRILEGLAELKPMVKDTAETVTRLEVTVQSIQIRDAQQDVHLENLRGDVDGLGTKIREHLGDHWKWFAGLMVGVTGVVGTIMAAAQFLSE